MLLDVKLFKLAGIGRAWDDPVTMHSRSFTFEAMLHGQEIMAQAAELRLLAQELRAKRFQLIKQLGARGKI